MSKEPKRNQIIFIDLGYRGKPYLITEINELKKEAKDFLLLYLLAITSQDKEEIEEEEKKESISQHKIRQLPDCLKTDPSFIRIHRHIELTIAKSKLTKYLCNKCPKGCFKKYTNLKGELVDEYDFIVKQHEDYRSDKLNASKLLPPIKIEMD